MAFEVGVACEADKELISQLEHCFRAREWKKVINICQTLFRSAYHVEKVRECRRFPPLADLFTDICRAADIDTMRALVYKHSSMNMYFLEFAIALCDVHSMDFVACSFPDADYRFKFVVMKALTCTRQVGKLARLICTDFLYYSQMDLIISCGQSDDTVMAWITCCPSAYMNQLIKFGSSIDPQSHAMETLLMFGFWSKRLSRKHRVYATLEDGFRRQLLLRLIPLPAAPVAPAAPVPVVPGMLAAFDEKIREERLIDAVYMCLYAGRLDELMAVSRTYKLNLFAFPFALHWAVRSRNVRIVEYVSRQCPGQVNSFCELGFTPLMLAVFTERPEIVEYLLKMKHINTSIPSRHKLTAYDYAREIGQADIERLLQRQ